MNTDKHLAGSLCWADLTTSDAASARAFYSAIFGWSLVDIPMSPEMTYTMAKLGGRDVAGMGEQKGLPPRWAVYLAVTDVAQTCRNAAEIGGKVIEGPFDVASSGKMAFLADPEGAVFGAWQPGDHKGFGAMGEHGAACWCELACRDSNKAGAFYEALFGWKGSASKNGGHGYTEVTAPGASAPFGGMMQMTAEWGDTPPHWMIYFQVDDTDEACKRIAELGGKVCVGPHQIPGVGRFAVVNDPQGATFSIIKLGLAGARKTP